MAFWLLKHKNVGKPNPFEQTPDTLQHPMLLSHEDVLRYVKGNIMEMSNLELDLFYKKLIAENINVKDGLEIDIATFSSIF